MNSTKKRGPIATGAAFLLFAGGASAASAVEEEPTTRELFQEIAPAPVISTMAAYQNVCTAGRGCWQGTPPTLNIGSTLGITDGNWVRRRNG